MCGAFDTKLVTSFPHPTETHTWLRVEVTPSIQVLMGWFGHSIPLWRPNCTISLASSPFKYLYVCHIPSPLTSDGPQGGVSGQGGDVAGRVAFGEPRQGLQVGRPQRLAVTGQEAAQ